jgi:hypothetical protein
MQEHIDMKFNQTDRIYPLMHGKTLGRGDVLAEIAGRDSIGAVVALARHGGLRRVLPTMAYTGTEYGDLESLYDNVTHLRRLLSAMEIEVMEPVIVGSPRWWNAVVGRVNSILTRRYGPWHICIGCHMYLHAVRVPLAWRTGADRIVAGERLQHKGVIKINQIRPAVDAYRRLLGEWGVELEMPLLEVDDEDAIVALAGDWEEDEKQPGCVLSGNYRELQGGVIFDDEIVQAYLDDYLIPVTSRILNSIKEEGRTDYGTIVEEVLA